MVFTQSPHTNPNLGGAMLAHSLFNFPAERTTLRKPSETTCGLTKHDVATATKHYRLRVAVHCCDLQATRALHVHEETIRRLDHTFQLVLGLFFILGRIEEVDVHGCVLM